MRTELLKTVLSDLSSVKSLFNSDEAKKQYASQLSCLPEIQKIHATAPLHGGDIYFRVALHAWFCGDLVNESEFAFRTLAVDIPKFRSERLLRFDDVGLNEFVVEAIAKTLLQSKAPDREVLRNGANFMLEFLSKKKRFDHVTLKRWQIDSCFIALLANEPEIAKKILSLLQNNSAYPETYGLLSNLIASIQIECYSEVKFIRIKDEGVRKAYLRFFDAHRCPSPALFYKHYPKEYSSFLSSGLLGPYCLAWFYLQAFAPEPVEYFSREDMFALLTT